MASSNDQKYTNIRIGTPGEDEVYSISIIIPCYNNADTLERCVNSAIIQDVPGMEIIVVDDASTDMTASMICEFSQLYPELIRATKLDRNRGAGEARNAGMAMARGQFITFIDADDALAGGTLNYGIKLLEENEADIVAFDEAIIYPDKKDERWNVEPGVFAGEKSLRHLLLKKAGGYGSVGRIYRKSLLNEYHIQHGSTRVHEDMFFTVKAFYHSSKTIVVPRIGYYVYRRSGSTSLQDHGVAQFQALINFTSFLTEFFVKYNLELDDEMYAYCIFRAYTWDRESLYSFLASKDADISLEKFLTEDVLCKLGKSPELLKYILADYAALYCQADTSVPVIRQADLDWHNAILKPQIIPTVISYGNADQDVSSNPDISVIMPNYNKGEWLDRCLSSILSQDMKNFELIVVDDASTDGSYQYFQGYADIDPRIRLYRMDINCRQGICRNVGLEKARGKYIIFVDSDDICSPGYFYEVLKIMERHEADIAIFGSRVQEGDHDYAYNNMEDRVLNSSQARNEYFRGRFQGAPWAKAFNREFLKAAKCQFSEYVYHQDIPFFFAAMGCAEKVVMRNFMAYERVLSKNSSIRPASVTYLHLHSAFVFYYFLQKSRDWGRRNGIDDDYLSRYDSHFYWNFENVLLPKLRAYWQGCGEIPISREDLALISSAPDFLRCLLAGTTRCWSKSSIPWGLLPQCPQRRKIALEYNLDPQPLLTAIIPVYNQEEHIATCLDSVLNQSLKEFEIIVIDDGSTDFTAQILQEYARMDGRIRVVRNVINRGQGYSRNIGLSMANGKYVTFIDSDDYVLPDFFMDGVARLTLYTDVDFIQFARASDRNLTNIYKPYDTLRLLKGAKFFRKYLQGELEYYQVWGKIFRLKFLQESGAESPEHLFEDVIYLLKVYAAAKMVLIDPRVGYVNLRTLHSHSTMKPIKYTPRHVHGYIARCLAVSQFINCCESIPYEEKHRAILGQFAWGYFGGLVLKYLSNFAKANLNPLPDADVANLRNCPELLQLILEQYSSLYVGVGQTNVAVDTQQMVIGSTPAQGTLTERVKACAGISNPFFTIIVYVGEDDRSLESCMDCVLRQRNSSCEILLINDGPSAASLQLCNQLALKYEFVRYFQSEHEVGRAEALNQALREAKGEYAVFLDASIMLQDGFLNHAQTFLAQNMPTMGSFSTIRDMWGESITFHTQMGTEEGWHAFGSMLQEPNPQTSVYGRAFRRNFLMDKGINFMDSPISDLEFLAKVYLQSPDIAFRDIISVHLPANKCTENRFSLRSFINTIYSFDSIYHMIANTCDINTNEYVLQKFISYIMKNKIFHNNILYYIAWSSSNGFDIPDMKILITKLFSSLAFLKIVIMDYAVLYDDEILKLNRNKATLDICKSGQSIN